MVPSVTMNGSILPSVVVRPLNRPQSAPTASDSVMAATMRSVVFSISPEFRNRIVRPETKAAIAPTERSRPPPVMTNVCPTAIVAMNVLRAMTLVRLSKLRKRGLASPPRAQISASARNGATALTLTRRPDTATGPSCTACVMPGSPPRSRFTPVASTTIACSFIASPATSPTTRPFRITMMRWQIPISSAISDEMTITDRPSAASAAMNR